MPPYRNILTETDAGVGIVTLNRPACHNAFDAIMIAELADVLERMAGDDAVRLIVVSSTGKSFCAGADHEADHDTGAALDGMLSRVAECPKPVLARVQGPACGAGVGLIAACDMAVATFEARFSLAEVKPGTVPAVIGPHVIAAIGERYARRYMLTAELFSAAEAYRIGLIHEMVADATGLDEAIGEWVGMLLKSDPQALAACKALIRSVANRHG